eukprot:1157830-Pelagomonas_calceolata.AAC.5
MPKKTAELVPGQQRIAFPEKRKVSSLNLKEGPLEKKSRASTAAAEGTANAPRTRSQLQQKQISKTRELRPRSAPQPLCLQGTPREEKCNPSTSQVKKPAAVPASKPKKQVGDDVYLIATDDLSALPDDTCQDLCVKCGKGHAAHTIVECEHCLGGYHMGCLQPKLTKIPEVLMLGD